MLEFPKPRLFHKRHEECLQDAALDTDHAIQETAPDEVQMNKSQERFHKELERTRAFTTIPFVLSTPFGVPHVLLEILVIGPIRIVQHS